MKTMWVLFVQVLVTLAVGAILMAVVVPQVPVLQSSRIGPFVLGGGLLAILGLVWLVWPRPKGGGAQGGRV